MGHKRTLFNDGVSGSEQRSWNFQAEYLGGRVIDSQFEFAGLLDRDVARFRPAQNLVDQHWVDDFARKDICSFR